MASLMHIVLIAMYVQCSMNKHTSYILFPYECTLNALFTLQCHRRDVHSMCPEFAYNVHYEAHFNVLINAHCIDCDVGSMSN